MRENEQELRLALAMRGGSSMAVWIGGAVAEINRLRSVTTEDRGHPWARLARLAGYDSVSVDVLAGSSAGGLNATLLAASMVYGLPFDNMREIWVRLGDLEAMARPVPKFWEPDPVSLLEGDDYFRAELVRVLREGARHDGHGADRVAWLELLLTATLLDPVVEHRVDSRGGTLAQERRSASFRFLHWGKPGPLSDFGAGADFDGTAMRLAHAARATSSFPFAFEPAQVHSNLSGTGSPDMSGIFSETTDKDQPFRVIDGGVLDNIPVAAAVRAIAAAPATRPTDRWLLYLNPEPELARADRPYYRQLAVPVTSVALQAKMAEESLLADIDAMEEHNRQVERTALRRGALFAEIGATEPAHRAQALASKATAVRDEHARVRAELDAQAVYRLLTDPGKANDGNVRPPVVGDPLAGWSAAARGQLAQRLSDRMGSQADGTRLFADGHAFGSAVEHALSWARDIERWADKPSLADIGWCKAALYRLRAFAAVLTGYADRYWVNAARQEPIVDVGELDDWVDRVRVRQLRLQHELPAPVGPMLGAVLESVSTGSDFQTRLSELATELRSIVESSGADAVTDNGDVDSHRVDAVADATRVLHEVIERLAASAPPRSRIDEPEQLGFSLLETASDRAAVLRQLVVLTAPLDIGREPGAHINLLRVSGDQQSPLPFDALRRRDGGALWLEDKVRGGDLGNFASFLSARWRANDWMWGRVDAATSLIALLLDPRRLVRHNAELGPDGVCAALGEVITTVTPGELGEEQLAQWRGFLTGLWSAHRDAVLAEIEAAFADPEGEHPLTETKKALSERMHWMIVAGELPYVAGVSLGADPAAQPTTEQPTPDAIGEDVRRYAVGRQRLSDLGERRMLTVASRFALLAFRAVLPSRDGLLNRLGRGALTLLKPLLMTVVFAVAAPRRAALSGLLAASAIAFTDALPTSVVPAGGESLDSVSRATAVADPESVLPPGASWSLTWRSAETTETTALVAVEQGPALFHFSGTSYGVGAVAAALLVVAFACWLSWQVVGRARWPLTVFGAVAIVGAELWLASTGFRLGVLGLALVGGALTWLATVAYRPLARLVAALLTTVVTCVVWWTVPAAEAAMPLSILGAGYVQMIILGTVDVLRSRPRTAPAGHAEDQGIGSSE